MSVAHPAPGEAAFPPSTLPNTAPFRAIIGFSRLNSEAHRHPMVIVRGEGIRPFDSYRREYVGGVVGFEPLATGARRGRSANGLGFRATSYLTALERVPTLRYSTCLKGHYDRDPETCSDPMLGCGRL
jgi:hypothetical protein